ncbi:MAG: class I SAM-dependent methyltransferase [Nitrospira sp.]|nr:class I SAM-dependent methyltransferase [Nitrospira sp.]
MSDMSTRHEPERLQREILEKLFAETELSTFEMFRNFPVFTPRYNIARFLEHYEIFKKIIEVPGVIIDLGVFRGGSTFTWAKLCEIFCPTDIRKAVIGFDTFSGFVKIDTEDGLENPVQDVVPGGYFGGKSVEVDLALAQEAMNHDRHLRHKDRIQFVKGDVCETIPKYVVEKGEGLRVALLNLDLDLYEPTRVALECFVPKMARGGIIVVDEYAVDTFGGETKAVDEYFVRQFGKRPRVIKFPWHSNPTGFIELDW